MIKKNQPGFVHFAGTGRIYHAAEGCTAWLPSVHMYVCKNVPNFLQIDCVGFLQAIVYK